MKTHLLYNTIHIRYKLLNIKHIFTSTYLTAICV